MTAYVFTNGRALLPGGVEEVAIRVEDGVIAEIGAPPTANAVQINTRGLLVAPAMIDIHGDAFERQVMPRPGVTFPLDVAVHDTDRQLAANGIATPYHALTLSYEPGLRSVAQGAAFLEMIEAERPRLTVDHRVQLRWETFCLEAIPFLEQALQAAPTPALAFNDHTSMTLRSFDTDLLTRPFDLSPDFKAADFDDPRLEARVAGSARRAKMSNAEFVALMKQVWSRRPEVEGAIRRVAEMGRAAGAPMLSHDDSTEEARSFYREFGSKIAEFPMSKPVAERAKALGEAIVFGAPNVVRGGSHIGSLSAADMVEEGLCDALASDYAYFSLLAAMGRLMAEKRGSLGAVWACVSSGPARALGLEDRGEIAVGKRADLVALEWPEGRTPLVRATFSAGRPAYLSGDVLS